VLSEDLDSYFMMLCRKAAVVVLKLYQELYSTVCPTLWTGKERLSDTEQVMPFLRCISSLSCACLLKVEDGHVHLLYGAISGT
jgi:hypothetical protein